MNSNPYVEIPAELVRRARSGDREAFGELYQRSSAVIYRTVCSMVRSEDTAWDVLQNTYIRAWRGLGRLEKPEAFLPWLRRIAVNETVKELSREKALTFTELAGDAEEEPKLPETREGYQPEIAADNKEAARLVREILEKLPEKQQLILGMYYYEQYSVREISEMLHVAPGTVKAQLHLGRKKVEAEVKRLEGEGVRLCGLSPMAFLVALEGKRELPKQAGKQAMRAVLAKTSGEPVVLTAKAAGGFFHTVLGKVTAVALAAAVTAGGVLGVRALLRRESASAGDVRPPETVLAPEREDPGLEQTKNPFDSLFASFDPTVLAAVENGPFPEGSPAPAVVWNEGETDRLIIWPRHAGSTVSASRILYDGDGAFIEQTPTYSTVCGEGEGVGASLERPAEGPAWVVTVRTPDGEEASWVLTANSRYGTPRWEYLTCGSFTGQDADDFAGSVIYGSTAVQLLEDTGYDTRVGYSYVYNILPYDDDNPFVRWGESRLCSVVRAFEPYDRNGASWMYNEWYADESTVWTKKQVQTVGDTCRMEAAVVHEMYIDEMGYRDYLAGKSSSDRTLAETVAGQAELFEEMRMLGYMQPAEEGEELRFSLYGVLVYNPTLAAKTVSVTVNGEDAGEFSLTEGDFFTWIPLNYGDLPADRPVQVDARVTQTLFGTPEEAVLDLLPDMGSNFRGGR